jgi:hypothetical protein
MTSLRKPHEIAMLTRQDIHTILVEWMGWEPIDVQGFWLVCAKLAKREPVRLIGTPRPYLVKTNRITLRVEGASSAADAISITCKSEGCPRSAIRWVKPAPPA